MFLEKMIRNSSWFAITILLLLVLTASIGKAGETKTLMRTEDPIVIKAETISALAGAEVSMLCLLIWKDIAFSPVPFQVDERTEDGLFVYTDGPKADPGEGNKKYDGNDELVFMAWDTGDRAPEGAALPCSASRSVELEIKDPLDGGKGWVYLAECSSDPPRSKVDYVITEFDGERDWVKTDRYHFAEIRGEAYFDRLALVGPEGRVGANHCDRVKGRAKLTLAGNILTLDMHENDLKGSVQAWIDGPVRIIRRMIGYVQASFIKLRIGGSSENLFYPNYYVTPIQFYLLASADIVLSSWEMRYTIDWEKGFEGTRYYDPINTGGVVLDGVMSPEEQALDYETKHDWYALAGPHGNLVVRMIFPEGIREAFPLKLYYIDDRNLSEEPESEPGQRCAGFIFDLTKIKPGKYNYYLYYMVPKEAPPESVPALLSILDNPLQVKSRALP